MDTTTADPGAATDRIKRSVMAYAFGLTLVILIAGCSAGASIGTSDTTVSSAPTATPDSTATVETTPLPAASDWKQVGWSVADHSLPDVSRGGEPFYFQAEPGSVLAVYFGYTTCPDVCPTTLSDVKRALTILEDDADRVTVAMVTVDPIRDSAETITEYVQFFVPGSHALRLDDEAALEEVGDAFGADFGVIKLPNGRVSAFHTPFLYAVDDEGLIQAVWTFGAHPEVIASDLDRVLNG